MRIKLKGIVREGDFRRNDMAIYEKLRRLRGFPGDPEINECYLIVSKSGNQICWVLNYQQGIPMGEGRKKSKAITTIRMRLNRGEWNPYMTVEYAAQVGIKLVGLREFRDQMQAIIDNRSFRRSKKSKRRAA